MFLQPVVTPEQVSRTDMVQKMRATSLLNGITEEQMQAIVAFNVDYLASIAVSGTSVRPLPVGTTPVLSSSPAPVSNAAALSPAVAVVEGATITELTAVAIGQDQDGELSTDSETDAEALLAEQLNNPNDARPKRSVKRIAKQSKKEKQNVKAKQQRTTR